jgi:hypothetical protein
MLTEGWKSHGGGCGDVPPSHDPTVPGMALQCLGWRHSGGDGHIGAEVTEEIRPAGLTSRHRPARAQGRHSYLFRGFRRPPSRGARGGVREWEAQCHGVDTGLAAQLPHSAEDDRTGWVGGTTSRYDSQVVLGCRRGGIRL